MNKVIMEGVDLSTFQGNVNFSTLKDTAKFAIIRAGYGRLLTQKDKRFEEYYKGCKDNGIHVGAYWYSYAMDEDEAREEARVFLETIGDKQFDMPVYYDVEESKQFALGKEKVSAIIKAFLSYVEAKGYWVGLYSSTSALNSYVTDDIKQRYAIWVAHWGVSEPTYKGQYGLWQYADNGQVSGIGGNVDLDKCFVDYPTEIKKHGLNKYTVATAEGSPVVADEVEITITLGGESYKGKVKKVGD